MKWGVCVCYAGGAGVAPPTEQQTEGAEQEGDGEEGDTWEEEDDYMNEAPGKSSLVAMVG